MSSSWRNLVIWVTSIVAVPVGAGGFAVLASLLSAGLQSVFVAEYGSLLSGVSGAMFVGWVEVTLLLLGALSGFGVVHAVARRFRFGVGFFVMAVSLLLLYSIWVSSESVLAFAGRRMWISTCGVWLLWDLALLALGWRMACHK